MGKLIKGTVKKKIALKPKEPIICVIFTSVPSFTEIFQHIRKDCQVAAVVIPGNRAGTEKIKLITKFCNQYHIKTLVQPVNQKDPSFLCELNALGANLGISWSYSQIIPKEILNLFDYKIWNMHGGKLPQYRGASVLQWAIINGEREVGVTWHIIDEEVDAGYLLSAGTVDIGTQDTADDVRNAIFLRAIEDFKDIWEKFIQDGIEAHPISVEGYKPYRQRRPIDGLITSNMTFTYAENMIRALCPPWPAPFLYKEGELYEIIKLTRKSQKGLMPIALQDTMAYAQVRKINNSALLGQAIEIAGEKNI